MESSERPAISRSDSAATVQLSLTGSWRAKQLDAVYAEVQKLKLPAQRRVVIDAARLTDIDTASATVLLMKLLDSTTEVEVQHAADDVLNILTLVRERWPQETKLRERDPNIFQFFGHRTINAVTRVGELLAFIGHSFSEFVRLLIQPPLLRGRELVVQLERAGLDAIPVVAMMMFLIGVVIAYLFATQIEKYGANIFIVDGVSIAICRELSPVIVAIIVAGRSGSAFTAHIGAMKLNEEIDAMKVMSLSPMQVLVIPRFLALVFALPALVFIGDVVGIFGGMVIADFRLGVTMDTFVTRLQDVLRLRHFLVGMIKAPVFAAFIAIIGCKMGLGVENTASSVGLSTTSTVVQSIVAVILLNAAFAVIFVELGI